MCVIGYTKEKNILSLTPTFESLYFFVQSPQGKKPSRQKKTSLLPPSITNLSRRRLNDHAQTVRSVFGSIT